MPSSAQAVPVLLPVINCAVLVSVSSDAWLWYLLHLAMPTHVYVCNYKWSKLMLVLVLWKGLNLTVKIYGGIIKIFLQSGSRV